MSENEQFALTYNAIRRTIVATFSLHENGMFVFYLTVTTRKDTLMKKLLSVLSLVLVLLALCLPVMAEAVEPISIKVLILPKFEAGDMAGDFPGEA